MPDEMPVLTQYLQCDGTEAEDYGSLTEGELDQCSQFSQPRGAQHLPRRVPRHRPHKSKRYFV